MKRQFVACPDCSTIVAEVFVSEGRRRMKYQWGGALGTVRDGEAVALPIHSQWLSLDVEEELSDCADSFFDVECACADKGKPRKQQMALRRTLQRLGTRRSCTL